MNVKQKVNVRLNGGALTLGIIVAMAVTLVSAAVLAGLEINETIDETKSLCLPYGVPVLATWIGCMCATGKGRGVHTALLTALVYGAVLLLCGLLGFSGELASGSMGLLLVATGMAFALLTRTIAGGKRRMPINRKLYKR